MFTSFNKQIDRLVNMSEGMKMRDSFSSISILDFSGCQDTLMIGWMGVELPAIEQKYKYILHEIFNLKKKLIKLSFY